jgi:hypothetical protein
MRLPALGSACCRSDIEPGRSHTSALATEPGREINRGFTIAANYGAYGTSLDCTPDAQGPCRRCDRSRHARDPTAHPHCSADRNRPPTVLACAGPWQAHRRAPPYLPETRSRDRRPWTKNLQSASSQGRQSTSLERRWSQVVLSGARARNRLNKRIPACDSRRAINRQFVASPSTSACENVGRETHARAASPAQTGGWASS